MSLYRSCGDCRGTLGKMDLDNGNMRCISCSKISNISEFSDNTIAFIKPHIDDREYSTLEKIRLANEPTTYKVARECENCKFGYMSRIHDNSFNMSFVCIRCNTIYE